MQPNQLPSGTMMHNRYRLLRSLSRGGMGMLYLASETIARQERRVVIKEMLDYYQPGDALSAERAANRFEAEAATLAALSIAGVPQVFDYFTENGHNYIVMQYIEGRNLESGLTHLDENDRVIPGKAYQVEHARRWGVRVCQILQQLANENVVHMDIKPANLIVDRAGDIWLVDFGTAKGKYSAPLAGQGKNYSPSIYGTLGYAPPEQFKGKPEPRSDVYALAATLYHLMTDEDPGVSQSPFARMDRLPPEVAHALSLALKDDVTRRITAAELGRLLEAPTGGKPFHWRDGTPTHRPEDLGVTADRNWAEALGYFSDGSWSRWFHDIHRYDLDQKLQAARSGPHDPVLALDAFLRELDPKLPEARLHLDAPPANLGILPWRERRTLDLTVENRGGGSLRASFPNLPEGLVVTPAEVSVHRSEVVQAVIDSAALSPQRRRQSLPLVVDAGSAGRLRLNFQVVVPEPALKVGTQVADFGAAIRGQVLASSLVVANQGGSPLDLSIRSPENWLQVQPGSLTCTPGKAHSLQLRVDTSRLDFGNYTVELELHARAGDWQQSERVAVQMTVSFLRTAVLALRLPLLWVLGAAAYAGGFGWLLGQLLKGIASQVSGLAGMAGAGMAIGAAIFGMTGAGFGLLGLFEDLDGFEGLRRGLLVGLVPGAVAGGMAGLIVYRIWAWITSPPGAGMGLSWFGGFAGLFMGIMLGAILYFTSRD